MSKNMCGINGFNWQDNNLIVRMNEKLKYRGPDDNGIFIEDGVSLGHTRLSIIDLSPAGHQPMSNEDQTIWIVFNGEIYNFQELKEDLVKRGHIFKSHTDTEVIIHCYEEYGLKCVEKFNGMWAFCIYDEKKDLLILSRDQFGIKPLYYYSDGDKFIFSSLISGIFCHDIPRGINEKAVMNYLAYNLLQHEEFTFFSGIMKLDPKNLLLFNIKTKKYNIISWYNPNSIPADQNRSVRDHFAKSVELRTISDVPIGSCLSGGLDSSAVVGYLNKFLKHKFNTFSFIVPGSPVDESKYIKDVGKITDTNQYFVTLDNEAFFQDFEDFLLTQEEPVTSMSVYSQYLVMKCAHEKGMKVLLDGQGGDELFCGYTYFWPYYYFELLKNLKLWTFLKNVFLYYYYSKNPYPMKMFLFLLMPYSLKCSFWKKYLNSWINHEYLEKVTGDLFDPRWNKLGLQESQKLMLYYTAIPHLLIWEDKNSMRWSIESRLPFLDQDFVHYALNIPSSEKLQMGHQKNIFRLAVEDIIPQSVFNRKDKIGFMVNVDEFMRSEKMKQYCYEILSSKSFKSRPYWNVNIVNKMFDDHIRNKKNNGDLIWKCINLEMWLRCFFDNAETMST
jgi:asparagine synthase (glutamine-hydrolysing)